jgi:hypothetical protein
VNTITIGREGGKPDCFSVKNGRLIKVSRRPVYSGFTAFLSGEAGKDMTVETMAGDEPVFAWISLFSRRHLF